MYHGEYQSFKQVEETIEEALDNMTPYNKVNSLRPNPAFHPRNKEANRSLKVVWKKQIDKNKTKLENTSHPKYLGVTLGRSLSHKQHIQNTKMQVATRNNMLMQFATSKRVANQITIRTNNRFSIEYAAPV